MRLLSDLPLSPPGGSARETSSGSGRGSLLVLEGSACELSRFSLAGLLPPDADLDGIVLSTPRPQIAVRNADFADGWRDWHTAGSVVLAPPVGGSRPDSCTPLVARIGTGGGIAQRISVARDDNPAASTVDAEIEFDPLPAASRLEIGLGAERRSIGLAPGTTLARARFDWPETNEMLSISVPDGPSTDDALGAVPVRRVALRPTAVTPPRNCDGLAAGAVALLRDQFGSPAGEHVVLLADRLDEARVYGGGASNPWVERHIVRAGEPRVGILAHPGGWTTTSLEFVIPDMDCPRRFHSHVEILPACRAKSDGAVFAATYDGREATVTVGRDTAGPLAIELDLDDPPRGEPRPEASAQSSSGRTSLPGGAPGGERRLVLATSAGEAHDGSCDWAVWVEPTVACAPEADTSGPARSGAPDGGLSFAGSSRRAARTIDLSRTRPVPLWTRWDEVNLWKLGWLFGTRPSVAAKGAERPGWLRERIPWATHGRVLAAFGGNTCRHIRDQCRRGEITPDHPFPPTHDGRCSHADSEVTEIVRAADDGSTRIDLTGWSRALDDFGRSGLLPHLNISAVPCALAQGHEYRQYHWNQRPVGDRDAWLAMVDAAAVNVASRPSWRDWRFSIVNEPNCLWIEPGRGRDEPPRVFHVGFTGTRDEYAEHLATTAAALLAQLPGARLHLGNFTLGGHYPLEDTLPEYLGAVPPALAAKNLSVSDFHALAVSLYETPQHRLGELDVDQLARLDRWIGEDSPLRDLDVKIDEVEVHPFVEESFRDATGVDLDGTRWAATWHAEFIALAIEAGVRSMAPWAGRLFADLDYLRPRAKLWAYAFASLAAGDVIVDTRHLTRATRLEPLPAGTPRSALLDVHRAERDPDGLGWIATESAAGDARWIFLWRHDDARRTDLEANTLPALAVSLPLATMCGDRKPASVEVLSVDESPGAPWQLAPYKNTDVRVGDLDATGDSAWLRVAAESLHLLRFGCSFDSGRPIL